MSQLVELISGGLHWHIEPELLRCDASGNASGLFQPDGPAIDDWVNTGQATVVKRGVHQSVYHVLLPGLDFYLKHYPVSNTRARLRSLLRPAKARLEFDRTRTAAARGLPTLTPLAFGETVAGEWPKSSYLVTRTLVDAVPLERFLQDALPTLSYLRTTRLRQRIAVALGHLLARMHHAGLVYRDLHPGNILLQLDDNDQPHLFLIDLYAVRFGASLSAQASRENLVILNRWFHLRCERSDRLRCYLAYQATCRRLQNEASGAMPAPATHEQLNGRDVGRLERGTMKSNVRFWRNLDRRCLETNRQFKCVRNGDVAGHIVADLEPGLVARLLQDPDELFHRPDAKRLKHSASSTVIELPAAATEWGKPLIYKRFAVTKWSDPLISLVRPTPALRSFVQGHGLTVRCLPTPRPLAVLQRYCFGLCYEGYLLTEKVEDAAELLPFVNRLGEGGLDGRRVLRRLIAQVARLVCTLHQRRLSHRDIKAANLLVRADPDTGQLQVWFIDLVGVVRHRKLRRGRRVQNLARLHTSFHAHARITRTDKLRFLRAYLRWGLRSKLGWKTWWRRIEKATQEKIARNLRNQRPLG
jgi:serine/threonine protein kinase